MTTRVLSSDTARASIQRLQAILDGGLADQLAALQREGATLSEPEVWDGREAMRFRAETWPGTTRSLTQTVAALRELRAAVARINQAIMAAGGNG